MNDRVLVALVPISLLPSTRGALVYGRGYGMRVDRVEAEGDLWAIRPDDVTAPEYRPGLGVALDAAVDWIVRRVDVSQRAASVRQRVLPVTVEPQTWPSQGWVEVSDGGKVLGHVTTWSDRVEPDDNDFRARAYVGSELTYCTQHKFKYQQHAVMWVVRNARPA